MAHHLAATNYFLWQLVESLFLRDQWTTKLMDAAVVQVSKPVLNSRH